MGKMLVIEGVMGVGKTTLLTRLRERLEIPCITQDFKHNICLDDYYAGKDCAFQKQMIFLFSNYHLLSSAEKRHNSFMSDFCFERALIMSRNMLKDRELMLYEENYLYLKQKLNFKKMLVFLHGDKDRIANNVKRRGRTNEINITPDYIDKCQRALIEGLNQLGADHVININIQEMDILSNQCMEFLIPHISKFMDKT